MEPSQIYTVVNHMNDIFCFCQLFETDKNVRILCVSPRPILKILLPKVLFILFDKLLYSKLFLEIPGSWCHCAGILEQSMGARNREE